MPGPNLFLSTDDLERDYKEMHAAGIRFVREPKEASYGTVAVFEDLCDILHPLNGVASRDLSLKACAHSQAFRVEEPFTRRLCPSRASE